MVGIVPGITASGVAEETVAGLVVAMLVGLVTWQSGRGKVITLGTRVAARLGYYWEWAWQVHPFHKVACAWWLYMMSVSAIDFYAVPMPDYTYNIGIAWILGMFGLLGVLALRRRVTNRG